MNGMANGLPAALFTLFVAHVLLAESWTGILLLAYFIAGIVALPGWLWISRRIGKHRAWALSMLWTSLIFIAVPFLGPGDTWAVSGNLLTVWRWRSRGYGTACGHSG